MSSRTAKRRQRRFGGDKKRPRNADSDKNQADGKRGEYDEVVRDNEKLWDYYRQQGIVQDGEEMAAFQAALRRPLPTAFRFQGSNREKDVLLRLLRDRYLRPLEELAASKKDDNEEADGLEFTPPRELAWYPGAFQSNMSRKAIRSVPVLQNLHAFLVTETELGHVSRQETVSMIPPLLLDVQPHHKVLDACAAPGSKTMQIIERMHEGCAFPEGIVVANDVDKSRCYLLVHQCLKRSPVCNTIVTCEDVASMQDISIDAQGTPLRFDRVLCDVICSGDGTFRKNLDMWTKWSPSSGLGLHQIQLAIARRSIDLLTVGGKMVYSTCSLNPIEDEAVVAQLLREAGVGALRLVDTRKELPGLKRTEGRATWKVIDREMKEWTSLDEIDDGSWAKKVIQKSMFPPTEEEAGWMKLEHTMRILPHLQDTGGFFVAVFEKLAETQLVQANGERNIPTTRRTRLYEDDGFAFLAQDDERWRYIKEHYGLPDTFDGTRLFNRQVQYQPRNSNRKDSAGGESESKSIFLVNDLVRRVITNNQGRLTVVNAGARAFLRTDATRFRLVQDSNAIATVLQSLRFLSPQVTRQTLSTSRDDLILLLTSDNFQCSLDRLECRAQLVQLQGGCLVVSTPSLPDRPIVVWTSTHTATAYVGKEEKLHFLRLLNYDTTELEMAVKLARKAKSDKGDEAATAAAAAPKEGNGGGGGGGEDIEAEEDDGQEENAEDGDS